VARENPVQFLDAFVTGLVQALGFAKAIQNNLSRPTGKHQEYEQRNSIHDAQFQCYSREECDDCRPGSWRWCKSRPLMDRQLQSAQGDDRGFCGAMREAASKPEAGAWFRSKD
jgi:hypothetical protein